MRLLILILALFLFSGISLSQEAVEEPPTVEKEVAPKDEEPAKEEAEKAEREKPKEEKSPEARRREKLVNIEGGFAQINVRMDQGAYPFVTVATGEITNNSGRDFGITKFMFSTYDRRGKLITEEAFHITDFYNGETRPFKVTLVDGYHDIKEFKIRFISGVAR